MLLVVGLGLYFVVSQTLNGRLQQEMRAQAQDLLQAAHRSNAALRLPGQLLNPEDDTPLVDKEGKPAILSEIQLEPDNLPGTLIVFNPDGTLKADGSEGLLNNKEVAALAQSVRSLPEGEGRYGEVVLSSPAQRDQSQHYLLYARPLYGLSNPQNEQSPHLVVALYVDSRPYEETATLLSTMSRLLLISLPLALIASGLIGNFVAGRALRPIETITTTARQIGASDLNRRLGIKSKDELGALSQTFDEMISRLQTSFTRQRRFLADASHELRTPLAVIEAEATLMLRRPRDQEDYQRSLELIAGEAGRMTRLIDDMLLLARADSGELEMRPRQVVLEELVEEAVERISRLARHKKQELRLEPGQDTEQQTWLNGDPSLLIGLFYNLLSNAVKYSSAGDTITIGVEQSGAGEARVVVQDNGPGIAPEHLPYLFDRFYRADSARTRSGSSGLGLAIAQWTAHSHGGRIEVESEVGRGSCFTVILPTNSPFPTENHGAGYPPPSSTA